ncbi:DNA starvation/stationary phase protection protein Dps [bacterium]|jgi:starvation-inducible DNA-binding protein|nr:DNA starvation/stationary phase protection protein Dps [bacterium]
MFPTKNSIPEKNRVQLCGLLQERLADTMDLKSHCKQAHWNVKGPSFFELHELFDKISADVETYVDEIAERMVQLGGSVEGTIRSSAKKSSLQEYPAGIFGGKEHVNALAHSLAFYGELVRKAIDQSGELKDADSADLFTEISRGIDKWLWMVEAHVHTDK